MKKKIEIFAVLLSLLVSIALPCSESITAMASEEYTVSEWCEDNNILCRVSMSETEGEASVGHFTESLSGFSSLVYKDKNTGNFYLIRIEEHGYWLYYDNGLCIANSGIGGKGRVEYRKWVYDETGWKYESSSRYSIASGSHLSFLSLKSNDVLFSDVDVYADKAMTEVWFARSVAPVVYYEFDEFCVDAGLNCEFVDVEGQSVEYTPGDMYVVRRGASADNGYLYYLTRVNIERGGVCFPTLNNGLVGVGTMSNEWQTYNVYQYEYDYTLGCWCATENFVSQEVKIGSPSSGLNCALGNGKGLVYSNRDLYSGDFSVAYAESTEFANEPFYGGTSDVVSPTPTPEVPSNGFDIVMYSSQIKAEVKADSVNMRDKPSFESNVVAAFIKTWNVDVLGYVYADDGAVWYYCKTVRDDMEYIGFIKAEYLTVLSVENNDFNIDFGDINLEDSPELIATAKNSFVELLGFVGVVPMMIGVVFGFLPSWCLGIVGVTVVVLCFLAIIKRG